MNHISLRGGLLGIFVLGVSTCLAYMGLIVSTIYDTLETNYLNKTDHEKFVFVAGGTGLIDSLFFLVIPSFVTFFGAKVSIIVSGCLSLLILLRNALKIKLANITFRIIDDFIWLLILPPQGYYLTSYSTSTTVARNAGIFWIFYSLSDLFANIAMYIKLHAEDSDRVIPDMTAIFWIYFGITLLGVLVMFLLPQVPQPRVELLTEKTNLRHRCAKSAIAFKRQLQLLTSSDILILCPTFLYIGMLSIFCEWVYEVALYHTYDMENQKIQSLLSGIFMATGGILASLMISFIRGTVELWGWNPILVLGSLLQLVGFLFVFLNIPDTAPLTFTDEDALITTNPALSVICCGLLGFGSACFITQTITLLGLYYAADSIVVFSIYKFFQSIGVFVSMFYIFKVGIYIQLGILMPFAIAGTGAFLLVDWRLSQELD